MTALFILSLVLFSVFFFGDSVGVAVSDEGMSFGTVCMKKFKKM